LGLLFITAASGLPSPERLPYLGSKLAIDHVKDCIKQVKTASAEQKRRFTETVELQIGTA
jgi:hypothetical protein